MGKKSSPAPTPAPAPTPTPTHVAVDNVDERAAKNDARARAAARQQSGPSAGASASLLRPDEDKQNATAGMMG